MLLVSLLAAVLAGASPSPIASAAPSCPPDRDVSVVSAVAPRIPLVLRDSGDRGGFTALILVEVDASGKPTAASVYRSSGEEPFDLEALRAARASVYHPAVKRCVPVAGEYLFSASLFL